MNTPYKKDFSEFGLTEEELSLMDDYDIEGFWDDVEVDDFSDLEGRGGGGAAAAPSSAPPQGQSASPKRSPFADFPSGGGGGGGGEGFDDGQSSGEDIDPADLLGDNEGSSGQAGSSSGGGMPAMPPRPAGSSSGLPPMPPRPEGGSSAPSAAMGGAQKSAADYGVSGQPERPQQQAGGGLMDMLQGASFDEFLEMLQENPAMFDELMNNGNWNDEEMEFLTSIKPLIANKEVLGMVRQQEDGGQQKHTPHPSHQDRALHNPQHPAQRPQPHAPPSGHRPAPKNTHIQDPDELLRIIEERNRETQSAASHKGSLPLKNVKKVWRQQDVQSQALRTGNTLGHNPARVKPPAPPVLMPTDVRKAFSLNVNKRSLTKETQKEELLLRKKAAAPAPKAPPPPPVQKASPAPQPVEYPEFLQHLIRIWEMMSDEEKENVASYPKEFSKDYTSFMYRNYPDVIPPWLQRVTDSEQGFVGFIKVLQQCVAMLRIPNPQGFIEGFAEGILAFLDEEEAA